MTEMSLVVIFALYLVIPYVASNSYNRSFIGWFLLTLIFTPILSFIFLALAGEREDYNKRVTEEIRKLREAISENS